MSTAAEQTELLNKEQQILADQIKSLLDLLPVISALERKADNDVTNLKFMADTTYVVRKCEDILDQVKKRLKELESKVAYHACIAFMAARLPNYTTENCTVSPNASFYLQYPTSPDKEGFEEFVKQLPLKCIRPHYPSVSEEIVSHMERGDLFPFGLNSKEIKGTTFNLRMRGKREL